MTFKFDGYFPSCRMCMSEVGNAAMTEFGTHPTDSSSVEACCGLYVGVADRVSAEYSVCPGGACTEDDAYAIDGVFENSICDVPWLSVRRICYGS